MKILSNSTGDIILSNNNETAIWTESDWKKYLIFFEKLILGEKIILIFIAILAVLGNTLVLLVTWKEKSLHQANKYFIACLAVADLLVGIFVAPLRAYQRNLAINNASKQALRLPLCRFMVRIDIFAFTASVYSLTFISFDRYLKISKRLQYKSRMTTSKSLKIIFIIWFISTAFAIYSAVPHSGSSGILVTSGWCSVIQTGMKGFYTFAAVTVFFLPMVVILVMYILIFVAAHKRQKMLQNGELGQTCDDRNQRTVFLQDLKVIRMLLVVVGVFILCWGPYFVWMLLIMYARKLIFPENSSLSEEYKLLTASTLLAALPHFNSVCNPVTYACLDQKYRQALKNLFQRMMYKLRVTSTES